MKTISPDLRGSAWLKGLLLDPVLLQQLLGALPTELDAAVLIVLHTYSHAGSMLPQIMQRASKLPAIHPKDRTRIEHGTITLLHLTINDC